MTDARRPSAPAPLSRGRRHRSSRSADRAVHVARALARPALRVPGRAARRPRPDRGDRADQGDRPVRRRPRRRADHVRDAEHHRRDQAPLPRQGLVGARAARAPGAERQAVEADRGADGRARPLADDPRARQGCRASRRSSSSRRSRAGARTARSRSRPVADRTRRASSTRWIRSEPRSRNTRCRRIARCSRPGSRRWTSASG